MRSLALAALLAVLAAPALAGCLESPRAAAGGPLPLDGLTDAERERALAVALADGQVVHHLAHERSRVVAVFLATDKTAILAGDATRRVEVHAYRYATDDVVRAVVDVTRGVVERVSVERFQPKLAHEEVLDAKALLAAQRAGEEFEILAILWSGSDPAHACWTHRCVEARFLVDGVLADEPPRYVDLSAERVVDAEAGA